jgi:hypothetical protein
MHNYGPMETTMNLLRTARKGKRKNTLENYYIQLFHHNNTTVQEQSHTKKNPLFQLAYDVQSRDTYIEPPA